MGSDTTVLSSKVTVAQEQLKEKNDLSLVAALQLLADLVGIIPGCLAPFLFGIMDGILAILK